MTTDEVISKVRDLPSVSKAAIKLTSLLEQPAVGNEEIIAVLKYDNVLTAKLLRACNSPLIGFEEQVSSVEQAVLLLGHHQILHVVLSLTFGRSLTAKLPGYAMEAKELWFHSLATALAAEFLATSNNIMAVDVPVAFTAGLLHDLGKLALNEALPAEIQNTIRSLVNEARISRSAAESWVVGTDHAQVGARLLEKWRLPEVILEAVRNHHHPKLAPEPELSAVIHLANELAHHAGAGVAWENFAGRVDAQANQSLGISEDEYKIMLVNIHESSTRINHFINLTNDEDSGY